MSLDIIAYDPKETKARKNKFKAKYGISYDKFDDEMIKPRKDMFCYYLHPELLESDIKKYEEMDDDAEKYHKKKKSLKFLATPSAHKRSAKNSLLLYRIENEEK